ncbi:MAG: caspase family protein [Gammaproteobacteria bacterium]|nr:caspase family protein [Gammaproteobacteria bacterium]
MKILTLFFCVFFLVLSGCTMESTRYAVLSTKEAGVFYKTATASTVVVNKVTPAVGKTKLDAMLKSISAVPDQTKYALVIGIENYVQQANVNFADNSAKTFATAAKNILGVPQENILFLNSQTATSGQVKTKIAYMKELAEPGDSLYFYFAGHGVPGNDGNTYLLPADMSADSIHLEPQLKLDQIYATLNDSLASRVYVFIDSCFSGKDDEGQLLFKGVAPVFKKPSKQFSSSKLTVMTAGGPSDFANQFERESQRLFSYFLIAGLVDESENIDSLYKYVRRNVKKESLKIGLGYKQIPELQLTD